MKTQKGKWKMIETCVVCAMFHVLDMCMPDTSVLLFYFCLVTTLHTPTASHSLVLALFFPFQALSIAGKCKQIRKQSLATFSDLT